MDTVRDLPAFARNLAPIAFETDLGPLPVTGTVPKGLAGMLLRNGPNPRFPADGEHWFAGDGMLHAFRFDDGRVGYRNRWVRTRRWQAGRAEGRTRATGMQRRDSDDGAANTNVVAHAGRLLALEEAHLPVALRGAGLDTLGAVDFGGRMAGPFTAHPKIDPATGELVFFGYGTPDALGAGMAYGTLDGAGRLTRLDRFEAPYASLVHDFAITPRHALFPVMPLVASAARAAEGGPAFAWQPEYGSRVGILRRDAPIGTIEWWRAPACYVFHTMNAWEEDGKLVMDVMQSAAPALFTKPDGSAVDEDGDARLCRWTFDLQHGGHAVGMEWLCDIAGEFPRIDDRHFGRPHRHGWFVGDGQDGSPFTRIVHVDHGDGRLDVHELPVTDCASEAVFVPRSAEAGEGDGWLLAVAYRGRTQRSDLLLFDAREVGDGPVAAVHLPLRVPNGFHGNWIDRAAFGAKE